MNFILKGNIVHNKNLQELAIFENGYLVCKDGVSAGVYADEKSLPREFKSYIIMDYGNRLILPGLIDLHVHAPQYAFRGLGMDLELLDWLNTYIFKEESRFTDLDYADEAYKYFVDDLVRGATTRAVILGTIHNPATMLLMDMMEKSGLISFVGKVNMDRNSPPILMEESARKSIEDTESWIKDVVGKFERTNPIITPRFVPTCSDELMEGLGKLQRKYKIPVQSHLSENREEVAWVKDLCPDATSYGDAYDRYGLFGGESVPTIMAHCVWSRGEEERLLKERGVYVAHCPQSNLNLASGIAPIRRFIRNGINVGLGSDVAGGSHTSIFRAMSDAIQSSKMYWRLVEQNDAPLTIPEVLYLATMGGGKFFGKVGGFEKGYELDAVVIDDSSIVTPKELTIENRLERIIYLGSNENIYAKYVKGKRILVF